MCADQILVTTAAHVSRRAPLTDASVTLVTMETDVNVSISILVYGSAV